MTMALASLNAGDQDDDREILTRFLAQRDARTKPVRERGEVAWGAFGTGEAFPHYERAIRQFERVFLGGGEWSSAEILAVREEWADSLEWVRRGAHARALGSTVAYLPAGFWRKLAKAECQRQLDEGDEIGAVRTWLDLAMCQVDFADAEHMFRAMLAWQNGGLWLGCWHNARLKTLAAAARAELARGLAVLDQRMEQGPDVLRYLELCARSQLGSPARRYDWSDRLVSWRHGFDPQLRYQHHLARLIEQRPRLLARPDSAEVRNDQLRAIVAECGSGPPGEMTWAEVIRDEEWERRHALVRLRLLRMALQSCGGGPIEALPDPSGEGAIAIENEHGKVWFRSGSLLAREAP